MMVRLIAMLLLIFVSAGSNFLFAEDAKGQSELSAVLEEQTKRIDRLEAQLNELTEEQNRLLQEVDRNKKWLG